MASRKPVVVGSNSNQGGSSSKPDELLLEIGKWTDSGVESVSIGLGPGLPPQPGVGLALNGPSGFLGGQKQATRLIPIRDDGPTIHGLAGIGSLL